VTIVEWPPILHSAVSIGEAMMFKKIDLGEGSDVNWESVSYSEIVAIVDAHVIGISQVGKFTIDMIREAFSEKRQRLHGSYYTSQERYVQSMPPYDFQNLVAALLRAMGFHVSWIAPPGPDKGIDILAHTDPLGTSTPEFDLEYERSGRPESLTKLSDHNCVDCGCSTGSDYSLPRNLTEV
jgi:Restriction endonuclease